LPTQRKLCTGWLEDVEATMPSFILSARDVAGALLVDVRVLMDGVQIATRIDARPIEADPGPHTFVFELADGSKAETTAVANERGKGKPVSVILRPRPAPPPPPPPPPPAPAPPAPVTPPLAAPPSVAVEPTPSVVATHAAQPATAGSAIPMKVAGLVAGGTGIVGLVFGTVFGIEALSTKGSHCDSSGMCDPGAASTAYTQATVSTVGLIAGGALLAGGVTLFLVAPRGGAEHPAASLTVAPMVGSSAGGLQLGGIW
jgi:hypothetical protein